MGYLSQKKKFARINFLLNISLVVISITSFLALFDRSSAFSAFINQWQFQIYLYLLVVFGYALASRFFIQAALASFLIIVNYMSIASSANLFNSSSNNGSHYVTILYQNQTQKIDTLLQQAQSKNVDILALNHSGSFALNLDKHPGYFLYNEDNNLSQSFIISKFLPLKSGRLLLSPKYSGAYMLFIAENQPMVLINIDFAGITRQQEERVYQNLGEFVTSQDNPVVIVGDFGIPAWSRTFQKFLDKTGLEVKNHIILSNGNVKFNPFSVPSFNVLAYKNFGVSNVCFLDKDGNTKHPLLIKLSF